MKTIFVPLISAALLSVSYASADHRSNVNMYEKEDAIVVVMYVPGVSREDINISVEYAKKGQILHVSGENKQEQEISKQNFYRKELKYGSFERNILLPCEIDETKINATVTNGVLTITMPKKGAEQEEKKSRKITPIRL